MALPKNLNNKGEGGWQKAKPITLGKTGFGDKLDAFAAEKAKLSNLATRNSKAYLDAADKLSDIKKAIPIALKKCDAKLQDEYKKLVTAEGVALVKEQQKYQGYVDAYINKRTVCGKELAIIENAMEAEGKTAVAAVEKLIKEGKIKEAGEAAKAELAKLDKIQTQANDSLAKPRVPGPAVETPHADDRPDQSVFTALIHKQQDIIASRKNAVDKITAALKNAMEHAK